MTKKTLFLVVLLFFCGNLISTASADDRSVTLTTWKDKQVDGTFQGVTGDGKAIIVKTSEGEQKFSVAKLLKMEFSGGGINTKRSSVRVDLSSGDELVGRISKGLGAKGFKMDCPDLPEPFDVSLMKARSLQFLNNVPEGGSVEEVKTENEDVLYKVDGDYYVGYLVKLGSSGAEFDDSNLGERSVPLNQIHRIDLTKTGEDPKTPDSAYLQVHCQGGSMFIGAPVAGQETSLTLKNLYGKTWNIPFERITSIIIKNGRTTFLSDLKPTDVVQQQRFLWEDEGETEDLPPRYRWQTDESVPKIPGKEHKIQLKGRTYRKGISCVPYTKLTYSLNGQFSRFQTTIGIDDRAKHPKYEGSVVFRVYVDGKKKFDSGKTTYSEFPRKVDVDVDGADTLTLEVALGEGFLDYADWAGARLIR